MTKCTSILILFLGILISCKNTTKKVDNENAIDSLNPKEDYILKVREFDQKSHLFLDFYQNMSFQEFRETANSNLKSKRLFYLGLKQNNEVKKHLYFSSLLDSTSFLNLNGFNKKEGFPYDFDDNLYYPINISEKTYYANISPQFDNQNLKSLSLSGPSFYGSSDSENEKIKRIKESREYNKEIIKMYSKKYGNPKITKRTYDKGSPLFILINEHNFDKNIYTFNTREKTIMISVQCCGDYRTEVKYILTSEYNKIKEKKRLEKNIKAEEQKKAKNRTLEDI